MLLPPQQPVCPAACLPLGLAEAPPFSCTGLGARDHGGCGRPVSVAPPGPIEPIGSTPSYSGAEKMARKRGDALLIDRNERSKQHLWKRMVESYAEIPGAPAGRLLPKAIALTSGECQRPYAAKGLGIPKDLLVLPDRAPRAFDVVTPYVVSRPPWLVGDAPPPPAVAWADRKLLFFSGHVPKPFNSRVRYQAWKATRRSADATVFSSTINCTIGAYEICRDDARIESEHQTFCRAACARAAEVKGGANTMVCTPTAAALRRQCKAYQNVDYADELDDVRRTDRVVPHDEYLGHAMSHRFCLVAPGDFVATHKITEAVALGGREACRVLGRGREQREVARRRRRSSSGGGSGAWSGSAHTSGSSQPSALSVSKKRCGRAVPVSRPRACGRAVLLPDR